MPTPTVIMPKDEQEQIRAHVRRLGQRGAALALEVNKNTLAQAAAGFGVARTTAAAIRAKLVELAGAPATPTAPAA